MIWPKKIIITIFIIAFIFLIKQTYSLEGPSRVGPAGPNKIEYTAEGIRDPFQEEMIEAGEGSIQTGPLPSLTIQGIVWGGAFPQAIINNKVVKIGDTIEQVNILDISKSGVIVLYGNQKYNLSAPSVSQMESLEKKPEGGSNEKKF